MLQEAWSIFSKVQFHQLCIVISSLRMLQILDYLEKQWSTTRNLTSREQLDILIPGRSPQQGLMDYVELAAMDVAGSAGWEDIVDPRLSGAYNAEELHNIAAVAHKCINPDSGARPSTSFVVQALLQVVKVRDG
ncbi:hypothetical protein OPV22_003606 [Ensete ventricosum]|uniref:Serine-threonine/tyrosine-protein kinase catalytic domain-containing protein n=1 Tax=Ensete ventricosum TaxID=4639 RepID=A0AAV8S1C5_ENSVE|nr:hypothetical protein OPV22_003606 [Ensete ventricosum]